jgi:glycine/D-amino acid oxidase-like deaminating enzyme
VAVGKALSVLPSEIAVVGCGIIGLTTAVVAQRAGLKVTIYTRDVIQRTRSFRAHGFVHAGFARGALGACGEGFGDLWEQMTRLSWKGSARCWACRAIRWCFRMPMACPMRRR